MSQSSIDVGGRFATALALLLVGFLSFVVGDLDKRIGSGQHCGCPASQGSCSLPCSSCCAPVCTFQPTEAEKR